MDQILAKASNQVVSFAIRSGISIASGYAIKSISTFLDKIPESQQKQLLKQRHKLKIKINIINITINLIKLASSKGNTILDSTLDLIDDLLLQFEDFDENLNFIVNNLSTKNTKESILKVETYMNNLLVDINEAIPILNLSLITSGINLNGSLNFNQISPGRLLQASNYINSSNNRIGPKFDLKLYTIFYNPSRLKYVDEGDEEFNELDCISWKETFARCTTTINRVSNLKYQYTLKIKENFNDDRYHEDDSIPITKEINIQNIQSMFFTASGNLLKLENNNSPVLILKLIDKQDNEEWIALGQLSKNEFDEEEEEEEDDDDDENEEEEEEEKDKEETDDNDAEELKKQSNSLSLLEYIIKLSKLQQIEQKNILNIPDEILKLYLIQDNTSENNRAISSTDLNYPKSKKQISKEDKIKSKVNSKIDLDSNTNRLKNLKINK
ncbi:YRB30 [Candida pseudojiufengensis]|uniref:YRB30 n=1 Tax=Candida pseudojiufengensis TaxID=497109 RepID=UPI00222446B9|nr:YRB30 [Candida pseudojiufengensis]KAI5962273.1 YRB30 [Candida pseudojiufengensis]